MNTLIHKNPSNDFDADAFKNPEYFFRPGVLYPVLCEADLSGLVDRFNDLKAKGVGRVAPWLIPAAR